MIEGSPEFEALEGASAQKVGRARVMTDAHGRELWRFAPEDGEVARRLKHLGELGLGDWMAAGRDQDGYWLSRAAEGLNLRQHVKAREQGRLDFEQTLTLALRLAELLVEVEAQSLFPGPLVPAAITVRDQGLVLRAEALVRRLAGELDTSKTRTPDKSAGPRWLPPEQAEGAAWDNRANRYVFGLIVYWMLAGSHAFGGRGLRFALDEQARRGAAPLPDDVAKSLPPGFQSWLLRLLDPDPAERPRSAADIADRLRGWRGDDETRALRTAPAERTLHSAQHDSRPAAADGSPPTRSETAPKPARSPLPPRPERRRLSSWLQVLAPVAVGLAIAAVVLRWFEPAPPREVLVEPRPPLDSAHTTASDCASCHTQQTADWQRSVMAHSVKSPLFQSLEILIEEQVGRDFDCPNGAGVLRKASSQTACRERDSGLPITGAGGEHWCVNCHSPGENLSEVMPAWDGARGDPSSRRPLRDLLPASTMEGISCAFCHQVKGPVRAGNAARGQYEGNPFWTSFVDGRRFSMRPEDARGLSGIANSGYFLDPSMFLAQQAQQLTGGAPAEVFVPTGAHKRPSAETKSYLKSSQFCGACHDVRLFGSDVLGVEKGEHFKRLRNAYSEWVAWAELESRAGREAASCQDCHMSLFPGRCVPKAAAGASSASEELGELEKLLGTGSDTVALDRACPEGTRFEPVAPGTYPKGVVADSSGSSSQRVSTHYFSGVDVPLGRDFPEELIDEAAIDANGVPIGARQRRDLLLGRTFRFAIENASRRGQRLELPVVVENVGAGHRVPAGFSQEREFWVHLKVSDARGQILYEVGRVDRDDEDLRDKIFLRINTRDDLLDGRGRPLGVFGAEVADGPDVGRWSPPPERGGASTFRGRGLVNFQNGFLRCVVCIGRIDERGECQPLPGQEGARGLRYTDGDYDIDTGECRSNLSGENALFETYFPVGSLDASRGVLRGPDAIIDRRSVPPNKPLTYIYELATQGRPGPFKVEARLLFRAFPPFLLRAFIDYERRKASLGLRPSGPLITNQALERLEIVELNRVTLEVP